MAITAYKFVKGVGAAKINAAIATEIAATRYPIGDISARACSIAPPLFEIAVGIGTGAGALTAYKVLEADTLDKLNVLITTEIAASNLPIGGVVAVPYLDGGYNGNSPTHTRYFQAVGH
jgi:hypothetical protein